MAVGCGHHCNSSFGGFGQYAPGASCSGWDRRRNSGCALTLHPAAKHARCFRAGTKEYEYPGGTSPVRSLTRACPTCDLFVVGRAQALAEPGSAIFAARTEFARAVRWLSFGFRIKSPSDYLRQSARPVNLARFDAARYHNFPAEWVIRCRKQSGRLSSRHPAMNLTVVPHPYTFFIRNAKVYACERPSVAPFQLSHPLVRSIEVASHGHCKDTLR